MTTLLGCLLFTLLSSSLLANPSCPILLSEVGLKKAGYLNAKSKLKEVRGENLNAAREILKDSLSEALNDKDWNILFSKINEVNEILDGAYQASFYDGEPYLTYTEIGRSYFIYKNQGGEWRMAAGLHPIESLIASRGREPEIMSKRFRIPKGMFLVGLETNAVGSIVPIFSTSPNLTFFRDLENAATFLSHAQSASPRIARVVPLLKLKTVAFIEGSNKNLQELPPEIQTLLKNGETLTTTFSTKYTDPKFVDPRPTEYSVLMIADENMRQGRTGIILKNGVPLLSEKNGQEYFLEIKGIGLANPLRNGGIIQTRGDEGSVRSGRIPAHYAENELKGFELTFKNMQQDPNILKLYSRSVVGVSIPEYESFFNYEGTQLGSWSEVREAFHKGELSGQIFRLATSTRRVAFADNPAFGRRYTSRQKLLEMSQRYYGKMLGDLLIRESSPSIHRSPHSENFVYFPVQKTLTHTDYADMEEGYELARFLGELVPYGVFVGPKGDEGTENFFSGVRSSLEPRGLWTQRSKAFLSEPRTLDEFEEFIYHEFIYPFSLKRALDDRRNVEAPLPIIGDFADVWLSNMRRDNKKDPKELGIQFRNIDRDLKKSTKLFDSVFDTTLGQTYFGEYYKELRPLVDQLRALSEKVSALNEQGVHENWRRPLDFYLKSARDIFSQEAEIYDSISDVFGFRADNRSVVRKLKIFKS